MSAAAIGILLAGLAATAPPARDAAGVTSRTSRPSQDETAKKTAPPSAPSAALLDYLGEYDEAADGVDPLGFSDPADDAKTKNLSKDAKDRQGSGP
ncbi:MAG TPA: hypothetical protein VF132_12340 [Rudaea sp.]